MKKRIEHEHLEQCALIQRVKLQLEPKFPECKWLYAVPNGAKLGLRKDLAVRQGRMLLEEGLRPGVSDLCLPAPRMREGLADRYEFPFYCGLFIEMKPKPIVSPVRKKISRKPMSPEQAEFQKFAQSQGYAAICCHGQDEAFDYLKLYLSLPDIPSWYLGVTHQFVLLHEKHINVEVNEICRQYINPEPF